MGKNLHPACPFLLIVCMAAILVALPDDAAATRISESKLRMYRNAVLSRIIEDNPDREMRIRELMDGTVSHGKSRIRLLDKFALFYADMVRRGISMAKARYAEEGALRVLFFVFDDDRDDQQYTLYLEYTFNRSGRQCVLKDIYFSVVFAERMKELKKYFMTR
jgi:hypothetical protein